MPQAKRAATFKRTEIVQLSGMVSAATTPTSAGLVYKDGMDDGTVAAEASERFGKTLTPDDIARFRRTSGLHLTTDGRSSRDLLQTLIRSHDALAKKVASMATGLDTALDRIEHLESMIQIPKPEQTARQTIQHDPNRKGNGFSPPRPRA